jgi:vacuolar-type H+-ATPase subunit I/STV1
MTHNEEGSKSQGRTSLSALAIDDYLANTNADEEDFIMVSPQSTPIQEDPQGITNDESIIHQTDELTREEEIKQEENVHEINPLAELNNVVQEEKIEQIEGIMERKEAQKEEIMERKEQKEEIKSVEKEIKHDEIIERVKSNSLLKCLLPVDRNFSLLANTFVITFCYLVFETVYNMTGANSARC